MIDSNVLVYALIKDYPTKQLHEKCISLLQAGLEGELDYILAINPIIVAEVFSVLRKLVSCNDAEFKVSSLLRLRHLAFLPISKEACQTSVLWAREKNIPVNDALIGANAAEYAPLVFTADEDHFKKLVEYGVKMANPVKQT